MILMAVIVKGQRYLGLKFLKYFKVQNMQKVKGREIPIVKERIRNIRNTFFHRSMVKESVQVDTTYMK